MLWALGAVAFGISLILRVKHLRDQRQMEKHNISTEELRALLASHQEVLLFDVRQPLVLLACPEMIPKAERIPS